MTWEQKLQALMALAPTELVMIEPGTWSCSVRAEVKRGCMLESSPARGSCPEEAVLARWRTLTNLAPGEYLVVSTPERRAWRWHGFMWQPVSENAA